MPTSGSVKLPLTNPVSKYWSYLFFFSQQSTSNHSIKLVNSIFKRIIQSPLSLPISMNINLYYRLSLSRKQYFKTEFLFSFLIFISLNYHLLIFPLKIFTGKVTPIETIIYVILTFKINALRHDFNHPIKKNFILHASVILDCS